MIPTAKNRSRPRRKAGAARVKAGPEKFWIRNANRELDRTGDFILKNLATMRREAASRAGSP